MLFLGELVSQAARPGSIEPGLAALRLSMFGCLLLWGRSVAGEHFHLGGEGGIPHFYAKDFNNGI